MLSFQRCVYYLKSGFRILIFLALVWGFIWLIQAFIFFALGVIVGLVAFKVRSRIVVLFQAKF